MTNVVDINSKTEPPTIVRLLEDLLQAAKDGKLVTLVGTSITNEGVIGTFGVGGNEALVIAGLELTKAVALQRFAQSGSKAPGAPAPEPPRIVTPG